MDEIAIITPCFNENVTVLSFLSDIETVLSKISRKFHVVVIDDASTDQTLTLLKNFRFSAANLSLHILTLKFNTGHQGAIYQGLLYAKELNCEKYIIMDSDGEDDPEAIPDLLKIEHFDIVNVVRGSRKESLLFQVSYQIYKLIFKLITGLNLNFGNYCMISKKVLSTSVHTSFIHFAAHLSKQKVTTTGIRYNKKNRLNGKSKMNMVSLIHHAIKSFVEYAEELLLIFLKLFLLIGTIFLGLIGIVIYKKLFTNEAILGWASTLSATLFNMALVCLGFFVIGILLLNMMAKTNSNNSRIYEEITNDNESITHQ